jgi:hypothetical protein
VVGLAVASDGLLRWQKKGVVFEGGGPDGNTYIHTNTYIFMNPKVFIWLPILSGIYIYKLFAAASLSTPSNQTSIFMNHTYIHAYIHRYIHTYQYIHTIIHTIIAFDGGGVSRRHVVSLPDGSYRMFYEG